ncbi:subtilisin-like protease [Phtheirospermum japonicum]|uniref:Subtilisin-like protease n=1 Tax=Phtheirospermum japonicum TaxID=374723 RepID=A0A830BE52_9LAMI|nr:subtilisin-like protease [Phtheirospermum japonicum]
MYVYSSLQIAFNYTAGFSAKLSEQHLESLKAVDGFLYARRDELRTLHTTHSPQFLDLRKGQGLWSARNLGSDVIIGLVDTGIWPEHPSFSDSGLSPVPRRWKGKCQAGTKFTASNCNRKLIGAAAFFKGYESARDSDGHGTHTASTAGGNLVGGANIFGLANGTAAGMRFTARIAAYKACYESGCMYSDILAAMEQAVKDGVDVLSLSLGGKAQPYYDDGIAIGAFGAIKKGVIVSISVGNSGPSSYTVENAAPWMMTVAASSTDRSFVAQVRLDDGKIFSGASLSSGKPTKTMPLVHSETGDAKFCKRGSLSPSLVKGKIVICFRGGDIGFAEKGEVVKMADAQVLPTVSLGASAANALMNYAKSSRNPTATFEFHGNAYGNRAPVMAAFSSRGPNSVDPNILKPDVTAPGCPHVSGLIALLKSLHRDWSPAAIKSALMTTAYVKDSKNNLISDAAALNDSESATPFEYGSGHVDPERASDPGLIYDISTQDYLDTKFTGTTYKRAVTNVGIAASTYSVKVIEPKGVSITVQPQVLKFRKMGEKLSYNVTFKAIKGDMPTTTSVAFGSLEWVSGKYSVRSPIAATWLI